MSYTNSGFDKRTRNALLAFVQTQPPPGMILWLAGATLAADFSNGGLINNWRDISGLGNNATGVGAQRPVYSYISSVKGRPAAVFDSTQTQFLDLPAGFANFTAGLSAYIVHAPVDTLAVAKALLGLSNNAVSSAYSFIIDTSNEGLGVAALQPGFSFVANTGIQPYAACIMGTKIPAGAAGSVVTAEVYLNRALIASGAMQVPLNTTRTLNYVGNDAIPGIFLYSGTIAEILLYNRYLTAVEEATLYDYIAERYDL